MYRRSSRARRAPRDEQSWNKRFRSSVSLDDFAFAQQASPLRLQIDYKPEELVYVKVTLTVGGDEKMRKVCDNDMTNPEIALISLQGYMN